MVPITCQTVHLPQKLNSNNTRDILKAFDCLFFISAIFFSAGIVPTPAVLPEYPVTWRPYASHVTRSSVLCSNPAKLAACAMQFRDYPDLFNFKPRIEAPTLPESGSSIQYWENCAGQVRGYTALVSSIIVKLLKMRQIFRDKVCTNSSSPHCGVINCGCRITY